MENRLKFGPYLTVYNKDFVVRNITPRNKRFFAVQEFKDPICEGFINYLELDKDVEIKPPNTFAEEFLTGKTINNKIKDRYFEQPLDVIAIKGDQLLKGKSVYQVDYCDIEADIKQKLLKGVKAKCTLPEGHVIPITTNTNDFRPPLTLSAHAMDPPWIIKYPGSLGQNEKVNQILKVKTGDSEYNEVIGKLGDFVVANQMHGKITHLDCGCLQHGMSS